MEDSMSTTRRDFLERCAVGAVAFGTMPAPVFDRFGTSDEVPLGGASDEWDTSWPKRLSAKHRAVFDVPEVDSGYGVWRASVWGRQYQEVLGVKPTDLSTAIVLRHNGIALAMQQSFWDKYGIGKAKNVLDPISQQPTTKNPALMTAASGDLPAEFTGVSLPEAIGRGTVVLGCNLALRDCVDLIARTDKISPDAARKQAIGYLIPGVILQPSGVFAAVLAQQNGCAYVRAS
jgi:hypothetical protein